METYSLSYTDEIDYNNHVHEILVVSTNLAQLKAILKRIENLNLKTKHYSIDEIKLPKSKSVFVPCIETSDYNHYYSDFFLNWTTHELQERSYYLHWVSKEFIFEDDDLKIKEYEVINSLTREQIDVILKNHASDYLEIEAKNDLIAKGLYYSKSQYE